MKNKSNKEISRKQEEMIEALLTQPNIALAARFVGCSTRTMYRHLKDPAFDAAYRAARRATVTQAGARLQQGTPAASTTILKLMDPKQPALVRLRAAEAVLRNANKSIELEDVDTRLSACEKGIAAAQAAMTNETQGE